MSASPMTKEGLLSQVDALRDIARRSRRVSQTLQLESDRRHLMAHVEELEESATRIEKKAVEAKTFAIAPFAEQEIRDWLA
jgi:hypothetical protein